MASNKDTFLRRTFLRLAMRVVGAITPSQQINAALNQLFAMSIGDRHPATLDQQLANKSWVFAANRQIAGRGVKSQSVLELKTRQTMTGKMPKANAVYDHPFLTLLRQPNLDQSGMVFHWQQLLQLNTAGRCYVLVEPAIINLQHNEAWMKALGGQPRIMSSLARMTLLEPERVRPYSALGRRAAAFEYFDLYGGHGIYPAAPATLAQREEWKQNPQPFVVRIFMPSPDTWNGQSPTEAVDHAINTTFGLSQMWQNQLKNGLHAGLVFYLTKKGMNEMERFQKAVAMIKAGVGKAGEPLVLPKETVEVQPSPINMRDMQYEALGDYVRREVLAGLGASDSIIGINEHSNRATADTAERVLAIGTIDPLNALIADAYNAYVLPLYPGQSSASWYELRYTTAAASDEVVQTQVLTAQAGGPIITPNEARAELDKPPVEGGDTLRQPKGGGDGSGGMGGSASLASETDFPTTFGGGQAFGGGSKAPGHAGSQHEASKASQPSAMPQLQRHDVAEIVRDELTRALAPLQPKPIVVDKKRCGCGGTGHIDGDGREEPAPGVTTQAPVTEDGTPLPPQQPVLTLRRIRAGHPLASLHEPTTRARKLRALDKDRLRMERACARALEPVFSAWKTAVGNKIRGTRGTKEQLSFEVGQPLMLERVRLDRSDAATIADTSTWATALANAYEPWAEQSSKDVVVRALKDYGLTDDQIANVSPDAMENLRKSFIQRRARDFADYVSGTQEKLIGDALSDGAAQQISDSEFAGLLEGTFPDLDDPRLDDIARTETTTMSGHSLFEAADALRASVKPTPSTEGPGATGQTGDTTNDAEASGEENKQQQDDNAGAGEPDDSSGYGDDVGLMWLSMRDDKVRDSHRSADGQVVKLGEEFELDGCNAKFPGDDKTCDDPGELVNCRCDAVIVPLDHDEGWDKQDPSWKNGERVFTPEQEAYILSLLRREQGL